MTDNKTPRPFGALLVSLREDAGLSKSAFARAAKISLGALWKYEHGQVEPGRGMLQRFAKALGIEYIELEREVVALGEAA